MQQLLQEELAVLTASVTQQAKNTTTDSSAGLLKALAVFRENGSRQDFLENVCDTIVGGRFIVRGIIQVESDAVNLRCSDSLMDQTVAVKVPTGNTDPQKRLDFLHE